ncbi:DUF4406 domain-containing protein [Treponema pectinovorum]|uniref:DUF4406 domain-containing protein n=1 Tax=Treponema pectinovorum TaxID=164 RepID=UPI0011C73854|nr:DUF4406 domain-containing protein [Treponema pectinovorum]
MKIYIAGKISGNPCYKDDFNLAEKELTALGHSVMNPAWLKAGREFSWKDYMTASRGMQEVCDAVFFIEGWQTSKGAQKEFVFAVESEQKIFFNIHEVPQCTPNEKTAG